MPKRLAANGMKRMLEDALKGTGLRGKLPEGQRRLEWQGANGFRKFFKSIAERHMKSHYIEMLMGHDTGLAENYCRPNEADLLADYVLALPELTFFEAVRQPNAEKLEEWEREGAALRKEVSEIKAQSERLAERIMQK